MSLKDTSWCVLIGPTEVPVLKQGLLRPHKMEVEEEGERRSWRLSIKASFSQTASPTNNSSSDYKHRNVDK